MFAFRFRQLQRTKLPSCVSKKKTKEARLKKKTKRLKNIFKKTKKKKKKDEEEGS
jgi:hypothetical protein